LGCGINTPYEFTAKTLLNREERDEREGNSKTY